MNHCKTCVHWKPLTKDEADRDEDKRAGGFCLSPSITEDYGDYRPDMLVYSYNEDGKFWTGPEFGCVHHKER